MKTEHTATNKLNVTIQDYLNNNEITTTIETLHEMSFFYSTMALEDNQVDPKKLPDKIQSINSIIALLVMINGHIDN